MIRCLLTLALLSVPALEAQSALKNLVKPAKKGDANAQYHLGMAYADAYRVDRDYDKAVEWLEKAAAQDHVKAQEYLGKLYYTGLGVEKDYRKAAKWLAMASELGNFEAQQVLANMYRDGQGVAQDHAQASYWYRMAAEQGFSRAQYNLGVSYNNGEGVERDFIEALRWLELAAVDPPQEYVNEYNWVRDELRRTMPPEMVEQAQQLAAEWEPKPWDQLRRTDAGAVMALKQSEPER